MSFRLKDLFPRKWKRRVAEMKRTRHQAALRRIASRGVRIGTVIDVGASDGRWSAETQHYLDAERYLLIEANEEHRAKLAEYCAAHPDSDFEIAAASARTGTIKFDGSDPFGGKAAPDDTTAATEVPAIALDDVVADRSLPGPYLLKLDTHGHEVPILDGAQQILSNASLVIIETYVFKISSEALLFDEMVRLMREKGFGVADMSDPLWRPGDKCFWQMDLYFVPLSHPMFSQSIYF